MTYLLGRTKPAGSPMYRSPDTFLTTRGLDGTMVCETAVNTCSFMLDFCIHTIYEYTRLILRLQTNRACIVCPVESESRIDGPESSSHDRCRIWIWALARSRPGLDFHQARGGCPVGLEMWEFITIHVDNKHTKFQNEKISTCADITDHPLIQTPSCREHISRTGDGTTCGFCAVQ